MPKQEFPFPMPDGWFCVLRSHELENGEVKSVKFCENDIAAFRTESGKIGVLDAYCGYSGINLALSGVVEGETLVSPQHGIKWDIDGSCAEIASNSSVPESAKDLKIFSYPVEDVNGFIWAWHHLNKEAPAWEIPLIEGFNGDDENGARCIITITISILCCRKLLKMMLIKLTFLKYMGHQASLKLKLLLRVFIKRQLLKH